MDIEQAGDVSLAGFALVMTADAVLGLHRGAGWSNWVVLLGGLLLLGGTVWRLHNDTKTVETDQQRLRVYTTVVALVLATAGFVLGLV